MSIGLPFSNPIISFKIFNSENKSKPSKSNKLSCFKYFQGLGIQRTLTFIFYFLIHFFVYFYKFVYSPFL